MALKWTNEQQFDREFELLMAEIDRKTVTWLKLLGERVVKYARENGNYTDRTANLRNSIGYIVVQYGEVVDESFGGNFSPKPKFSDKADAAAAQQQARDYALKVAAQLDKDKTYLVWVAGMSYARYVEAKGFDVLEGSGNWVESTSETLIAEFSRFLMAE